MANINLCRVCLSSSMKVHHIANTHYEGTFEKLSNNKLTTEDARPTTICFLCLAHLRRCHQFMDMSAKSEEILTQFFHSGIELNSETVNILDRRSVHKMLWTPLQLFSLKGTEETKPVKVEIKTEPKEFNEDEKPIENVNCRVGNLSSPIDSITGPFETVSRPFETVSRPFDNISRPFETVSRSFDHVSRPFETVSRPFENVSRPFETVSRPFDNVSRPFETVSHSIGNVSRPIGNLSRPIENINRAKTDSKVIVKKETVEDESNHKIIQKTLKINHGTVNKNISVKQEIDENVNQIQDEGCAIAKNIVVKEEMVEYETGTIEISEVIITNNELIEMEVTDHVKEEIEFENHKLVAEMEIKDITARKISELEKTTENTARNPKSEDRKKHECPTCKKSYVHKYHLLRHIKSHMPEPPKPKQRMQRPGKIYTCKKCDKTFIYKTNLKKHRIIHQKKYSCDLCPTKCREKFDFLIHMRKHTGEKPFTCDICNMSFSRKNNMRAHITQTHTEAKKFVCLMCNENFSRNYDLKRHIKRKHTNEKPFSCDICDFRSVNAHYIKKHIEYKHTGRKEKPYVCDICNFRSVSAKYIEKHVELKHGIYDRQSESIATTK